VTDGFLEAIIKLRIAVAFLGEKEQANWWNCSFLSPSADSFLSPVFPKTSILARVTGASAAAQLVHDEHIGVGDVYHLFRLPENIEQDISEKLSKETSTPESIKSEDEAYKSLEELAHGDTTEGVGPLELDQNEINEEAVNRMAAAYLAGFKNSQLVCPFLRGRT